jgi:GntR family transcriptional regulator / MocR family aminotransferase
MSKLSTTFDLMLPIRERGMPLYRWLYGGLRKQILEGRLRPGFRLPGTRDLAAQYGLSRGTIVNAFEQLKSEGYLEGSIGSGSYVSKVLPDDLLEVTQQPTGSTPKPARRTRRISRYAQQIHSFPVFDIRDSRAFRANVPALDLFPIALWTQITARRLRLASTNLLLGCSAMGYRPLREAISEYLSTSRGVNCRPEQVAIVSGVQEALDVAARLFLNPGDRVCMENPGYIGAALVFESAGASICTAPVDDGGMKLQAESLRRCRLVYVTPAHQFPLGTTMSLSRRLELLEWARRSGAIIFEDDYDSEFRYSGRPVPALQGLDRAAQVLFAGSFSKVLFPSLRLGYLVIPEDLLGQVEAMRSVTSRHPPLLEQAVLTDFIIDGHFGRHLRRMREIYSERLSVLMESAREKLAGLLEMSSVEAGLQTVGWLVKGIDDKSAALAAAARNVETIPLSLYHRGRSPHKGLQLGFAAVDVREIRRGTKDLAIALEQESKLARSRV